MKTYRKAIYAVSVLVLAASAVQTVSAQTGINSTVEVERDYEGSIARAVKSRLDAPVDDSLMNFKLRFDYTTFYNPYKDLYEFTPVMSLGPASEGKVVYPWLYARLAAAYPLMPSADIYVTPRLGEKFSLGMYVNHDSYWGKLPQTSCSGNTVTFPGTKIAGDRMNNRAGVAMGYRWHKGELKMDASYSGSMYALNPEGRNIFDHASASVSVRSTNQDPASFYYKADIGYRYFNNRTGVIEHIADADVSLGAAIRGGHKLYLRVGGTFSTYGIWNVSPVYRWEKDRWRIKAGATMSSVYNSGAAGTDIILSGNRFLIYPDASVTFEAARNVLWLYLKAYGENRLYTDYDIFSINPWMNDSGQVFLASAPVSAEFGLKGLVRGRFSYGVGVNYSMATNLLSFMSLRQGTTAYQALSGGKSQVFTASGMLQWKSQDFLARAELDYRCFSNPEAALMLPAFSLDAVLEYNLRQRLYVRADCRFRTSATGKEMVAGDTSASFYHVPAFVDVGLRVSYAINTELMVFVEGNNLANSKIQYFLNYVEPGINIGAGICLKL